MNELNTMHKAEIMKSNVSDAEIAKALETPEGCAALAKVFQEAFVDWNPYGFDSYVDRHRRERLAKNQIEDSPA